MRRVTIGIDAAWGTGPARFVGLRRPSAGAASDVDTVDGRIVLSADGMQRHKIIFNFI
jgi:hypothetical protein